VEEQFYLFWPLTLVLLARLGKSAIFLGIVATGLLSLGAALWLQTQYPSAVFFLMPFRIFQFALGGALAFATIARRNVLSDAVLVTGLAAIIVVAVISNGEHSPFWQIAVVPPLAATAIIHSANSRLSLAVLGSKPFVWIGQRSYSIYLAHWPIIVLWKLATDYEFDLSESIAALVASIVAGALLFQFVEKPFRARPTQSSTFKGGVLAGVTLVGAGTIIGGAHYWGLDGYPGRVPAELRLAVSDLNPKWEARQSELRTGTCNQVVQEVQSAAFDVELCSNPPKGKLSYLIIGDSFGADAYLIFRRAYPEAYFGQVTIPGCHTRLPKRFDGQLHAECRKLYERAFFEFAANRNYDGVILSSNWQDGHYYRIDEMITALQRPDFKVIIVGQRVRFETTVPSIVSRAKSIRGANRDAQTSLTTEEFKINQVILDRFSDRAVIVDMMALACPDLCNVVSEAGEVLILDDAHISLAGADVLAQNLRSAMPDLPR